MLLPNRWAPGTIFAASGLEVATNHAHPFIATPEAERLGLRCRLSPSCSLRLARGRELTPADLDESHSVCANELLMLSLRDRGRAILVWADANTLVGRLDGHGLSVRLVDADGQAVERTDGPDYCVLRESEREASRVFALGFDPSSAAAARARAEAGLRAEVVELAERQWSWLGAQPTPPHLDPATERAYRKACAILRVNTESAQGVIPYRWTTPDRWPHRHMWLWDSAFHAVGWRHLDLEMAQEALLANLTMVAEDGYLAHMTAPDPAIRSIDCTQPPVLGWAVEKVHQLSGDEAFLAAVYEPLCRYVAWDLAHRQAPGEPDLLGWRLQGQGDPVRTARGGESGWDNSPRFDTCTGMAAVDLSCQAQRELSVLARLATRLGRDDEAARHAARAEQIGQAVRQRLWDPQAGFFFDRDQDGTFIPVRTAAAYLTLWSGAAAPDQAVRLVADLHDPRRFGRPLPIPTVAADEPTYCDDMWRGPTWLNIDLLCIEGLADCGYRTEARRIAEQVVREVTRWYELEGTLFEFYDAEARVPPYALHRKGGVGAAGGTGFGCIYDYNFSAAVFIDLCWWLAEP